MYNPIDNSYTNSIFDSIGNNRLYHLDNIYYIRYYSKKALFALDKIFDNVDISNLEEAAFYYHVFIDMLFDAVGLLNDRFIEKKYYSIEMKYNVDKNKKEYNFNNDNYPLLNDKSFRNFIEHIHQRNDELIKNNIYYGTFNFVHPNMEKELMDNLLDSQKPQNNYLNLIDESYNIIDIQSKKPVQKKISLRELEKELMLINKYSNNIWDYMNDTTFMN